MYKDKRVQTLIQNLILGFIRLQCQSILFLEDCLLQDLLGRDQLIRFIQGRKEHLHKLLS